MFIQSFILCFVAIMLLFYKKFNDRDYKIISDKQQKVLYISNIINFRNSLFDYCNSLDLLDVKYEIENNDLIYMDRLLQIKNKIDNYYKQINDDSSDLEEEDMNVDGNITDDDVNTDVNTDANADSDTETDNNVNADSDDDVNADNNVNADIDVNADNNVNADIDVNADVDVNE
jgi:hypothetical protein